MQSNAFHLRRKEMRVAFQHKKTVKPNKTKKKVTMEEESKKENSAPPLEIADDIPDEVKPFVSYFECVRKQVVTQT